MGRQSRSLLYLGLLIGLITIFYITTLREGHPWADDFGEYAQEAKNISTGSPYAKILFIYQPAGTNPGPRVYPPVLPLILAAVYRWHGLDLAWMKLELMGFFMLSLVLVFYAFRRELGFRHQLILVAIVGFNPLFWNYKDFILSDIPFLFFAYLVLFLMEWSYSEEGQRKSWLLRGMLIGSAMYVAYATRTVGIVFIPVALCLSLIQAKRITKEVWVSLGVSIGLMIGQAIMLPELRSYASSVPPNAGSLASRMISYSHFYVGALSTLWDNGHSNTVRFTLFLLSTVLAGAGFIFQCRSRVRSWELFVLFYVPFLFLWEEDRYLFPLIPLYIAYALGGFPLLRLWKAGKWQWLVVAIFLAAIGVSYGAKYATLDIHQLPHGTARPQTLQLFSFIASHITDDDVIEFPAPRMLSLYTSRRAFSYSPDLITEGAFWYQLQKLGATYIITMSSDNPFWIQFVTSHQDCWNDVFSNSDFHVYQVRTPAANENHLCR